MCARYFSAPLALTLPSSKATYICHNEKQAVFYHRAAFHQWHHTKRDSLMQAVNTVSFIHQLFIQPYSNRSLDSVHYTHLIKSSHVYNTPHYASGARGQAGSYGFTVSETSGWWVCLFVESHPWWLVNMHSLTWYKSGQHGKSLLLGRFSLGCAIEWKMHSDGDGCSRSGMAAEPASCYCGSTGLWATSVFLLHRHSTSLPVAGGGCPSSPSPGGRQRRAHQSALFFKWNTSNAAASPRQPSSAHESLQPNFRWRCRFYLCSHQSGAGYDAPCVKCFRQPTQLSSDGP